MTDFLILIITVGTRYAVYPSMGEMVEIKEWNFVIISICQ
jgi:hypothetical protein